MNQSRRDFLQKTSLLAAVLPFARLRLDAAEPPVGAAGAPAGKRRGLLFDEADLPRIRANVADPRFAICWTAMTSADLADDTDFLEHHVRFNHHADDMLRVRTILERTSFVYVVTRDPKQLAVARLAVQRLLDYPKWDLFLEGGRTTFGLQRASEAIIALAFALDWLGDGLSEAERTEVERQIAVKGAPACFTSLYGMKYPDRVRGWSVDPDEEYAFKKGDMSRWPLILNSTNLKVIPIAGLGIAACLLTGRHPQAEVWLELARSSATAFSTNYGSDGSYGEGPSYWGYTTLHLALFTEVLWRIRGIDQRNLINFPGTINNYGVVMTLPRFGELANPHEKQENMGVPLALIPPRYDIVNFGDANGSFEISPAAWVARTFHDPVAQEVARSLGEAKSHYGLIWYDPEEKSSLPDPALLDERMLNDLVVSRTGWSAPDSVVALRSGGPANHEHADRNSVIFKAHGDRLFNDPFRAAYPYTLERWKLRLTESHTAVLIDGKGHIYHNGHEGTNASLAFAQVVAFRTGPGWMTVTSDATDAYQLVNDNVARVDRTLVFLKPDVLLLLDRVDLKAAPATVQVRFQVFNDDHRGTCTADGPAFRIERPFATLHGHATSLAAARVAARRLDLSAKEGIFPFAEVATEPARTHAILTACTAAPAGGDHGEIRVTPQAGGWRAQGTHRGQTIDVVLAFAGEGPPVVTL